MRIQHVRGSQVKGMLSLTMKREVSYHIYGQTLHQTRMFQQANDAFIKDIAVRLSTVTWGPMEYVCDQEDPQLCLCGKGMA